MERLDNQTYSIQDKINFVNICNAAIQQLEENLVELQKQNANNNFGDFLGSWENNQTKIAECTQAIARYKLVKESIVRELTMEPAFLAYVSNMNFESVKTEESENEKAFK